MIIYLIIAAILRLAFIWAAPLWYDEHWTLILSRLPFERMMAAITGDVHPPLWYLIEWLFEKIGLMPVWTIRIPALLFSMLSVWIFWLILQRLELPEKLKHAAMILMVISPFQLYYAQEARMYSLLTCLVLLAVWSVLAKRWIMLWLAMTALLYTQNYAVFYIPSIALAGFILDRKDWKVIFFASAAAGLCWLPWVPTLLHQMAIINGGYWIVDMEIGSVLYVVYLFMLGGAIPAGLQLPSMFMVFGWLTYSVTDAIRHPSRQLLPVAVLAFMPVLLAALASIIVQPVFIPRPLVGTTPFLFIMMMWPIERILATREKALYASIFILPVMLVQVITLYKYTPEHKDQHMPATLATIQANWQEGDIIYHVGDGSWINWYPYSTELPHYKFPDCGPVRGSSSPESRLAMGEIVKPLDEIQYERVWLVYLESPLNPPCEKEIFADQISTPPTIPLEDDQYIYSGVWLIEGN